MIKIVSLIVFLMIVGLIMAGYFFIVQPKRAEIKAIQSEVAQVQKKASEVNKEIANLEKLPGLLESEAMKGIPTKLDIHRYFSDIWEALVPARVSKGEVVEGARYLGTNDPSKEIYYGTYTFQFTGETQGVLTDFIKEIESNSRFIRFRDFTYKTESLLSKSISAKDSPEAEEAEDEFELAVNFDVYYLIDTSLEEDAVNN